MSMEEGTKRKLGWLDCLLEKLPRIHIWGYNYCGINTDLEKQLAEHIQGINELDCACMEHDIAYSESAAIKLRCNADKILVLKAFKRIYARDSCFGERIAAIVVSLLIFFKIIISQIEICKQCE